MGTHALVLGQDILPRFKTWNMAGYLCGTDAAPSSPACMGGLHEEVRPAGFCLHQALPPCRTSLSSILKKADKRPSGRRT